MNDTLLRPSRRGFFGLLGAAFLYPSPGRATSLEGVSGTAFGTSWQALSLPGTGLTRLAPQIDAVFARVDRQMSPWRGDSTLSRFNTGRRGWHRAEPEVTHVLTAALAIAGQSAGAFDPTVGPLVAQWGFGPIHGSDRPNWRDISVEAEGIEKPRGDVTLDLCGIAKGWALDQAVDLARGDGVTDMLFDLGGELRALGQHPDGRPWRVAVEHPVPGEAAAAVVQLLPGQAVATSGLKAQSYTLGGHRYGHIIDPAARAPADGGLLSVSVLSGDAMTADGWATALFAAGKTDGPELARRLGLAALFLVENGGAVERLATPAMQGALI